MGIVKRLDDQKRMIDVVRHELEELKSARMGDASGEARVLQFGQLARNIETALIANKQLADTVIKIRKVVSHLLRENEKLRQEMETVRAGSLHIPIRIHQRHRLSDAHLRILRAVSTDAKSSTEISRIVSRSREHTSRMVKRMVELGMFEREPQGSIPKYVLTETGKEVLKRSGEVSLGDDVVP